MQQAGKIFETSGQPGRRGEPLVASHYAPKAIPVSLAQPARLNQIRHGINVNANFTGAVDG